MGKKNPFTNWEVFMVAMRAAFEPIIAKEESRRELRNLQQTEGYGCTCSVSESCNTDYRECLMKKPFRRSLQACLLTSRSSSGPIEICRLPSLWRKGWTCFVPVHERELELVRVVGPSIKGQRVDKGRRKVVKSGVVKEDFVRVW